MFSKISWLKQAFGLLLFIVSSSLYAGVTISVSQSGTGGIIVSANGTLKVPSTFPETYDPGGVAAGARGTIFPIFRLWGMSAPSNMSTFQLNCVSTFSSWGNSGGWKYASSATITQPFGLMSASRVAVPTSTAGQTIDISNKLTFTSETLASMGFPASGTTVNCTTGSGADADTLTIEITGLTYQGITTSASQSSINVGGTSTVTTAGASGTGAVTYTSSNTAVATVNPSTGVVTGVSAGSAIITATKAADGTYASARANATVTVNPPTSQATLTVTASPATLTATTTTSTLSTSGGSGTGAVSYAMTAGTCTLSGNTVTAGSASETCTVTATKAADGAYTAATATVNITVARRASIAAAATDASVLAIHGAQIMQSQKFVTTQIENVANHLSAYRNNLNLRSSQFGFGVNLPSMGPASQALYKIKDELTPRATSQTQSKVEKTGFNKVGFIQDQAPKFSSDYTNQDSLTAEVAHEDQKQVQAQIDKSQADAANSYFERESLTYSFWTAGTIDFGNYKTGDNKETQNRLTANGLTMGLDYKLHDSAIVGGAIGFGTAWHNAAAINTNLKAKQSALTGYGMFGFADNWSVEGLVGYGMLDFTGNRTTSDGAAQLGVNRQGDAIFSSGTVSKMYWMQGYRVSPFVRQDVMRINLNNYAETGAVDYALGFDDTNFMHTTTSAGLQVSRDIFLEGAKLTPTAKFAVNRIRTGGLVQNIYYADTGPAGDVYTMNQSGSYMTTQSFSLGLMYITRAGDGFDLAWQGALGANQYKLNGLRFAVRFAM